MSNLFLQMKNQRSFYSTGDFSFEEEFADKDHHIIIQVLISFWYAVLSNTDLICYTVVFVSQVSASYKIKITNNILLSIVCQRQHHLIAASFHGVLMGNPFSPKANKNLLGHFDRIYTVFGAPEMLIPIQIDLVLLCARDEE